MNSIISVKVQGSGWLLNNVMHVPGNAPGNREYELIKQWLSEGNTPEPEFTEEELAQQEINKKIQEAKAYLANTDYKMLPNYVPKVDEDLDAIIAKRNETREFIRNNNA